MAPRGRDGAFFPPSRPREARGGIRAQSKRGEFVRSWWARRWIAALESLDLGARLGRGRSYARKGQVLDIRVDHGLVEARVQGSRPEPYTVAIRVRTLSSAEWRRVAAALRREARFAARLLASEMPRDVETAFQTAGLSLFPEERRDLATECSCPDWSNPCKHIAAVHYLLGEEFDRDPFLVFKLRGSTREDLIALMGPAAAKKAGGAEAPLEEGRPVPPEPLRADADSFWAGGDPPADPFGDVSIPSIPAAPVRRLGPFPFWRGKEALLAAVEPVYARASARGLDVFLGARSLGPAPTGPSPGR